eukprot:688991-Alexandrium_andersonii.AAC.1
MAYRGIPSSAVSQGLCCPPYFGSLPPHADLCGCLSRRPFVVPGAPARAPEAARQLGCAAARLPRTLRPLH